MFHLERHGNAAVIYAARELDLLSRESFTSILQTAERDVTGPVVVSLELCSYLDSTALNVLIAAHRRIGDRLSVVVPLGNKCRRILEICGLDRFLQIVTSVDAALDEVNA